MSRWEIDGFSFVAYLQTGEMEVKNPLFLDDPTPATPANANSTKKASQTLPPNAASAKSNQTNDGKK